MSIAEKGIGFKEIGYMSDLGDMIDSMWGDADPEASSGGGGCLSKAIRWLIFFIVMGVLIYFMKKGDKSSPFFLYANC